MTATIFSDLGQASLFMALPWVQEMLNQSLGYRPFPATLNVRPTAATDAAVWRRVQNTFLGLRLAPANSDYCAARLFRIALYRAGSAAGDSVTAAVLLPEVADYPKDKIEIVAPMRLKDHLGIADGDSLIVEFLN
jgi:CTP-dependent riboflavin kinase